MPGREARRPGSPPAPAAHGRPRSIFVGREREARRILGALEAGSHVIVRGPYGIGKTALARLIMRSTSPSVRFIPLDFSQTNAVVCRSLLSQLAGPRRTGQIRSAFAADIRARINRWSTRDGRRQVVVIDNVARITRPRLTLLRDWSARAGLSIMALIENRLAPDELRSLRGCLVPHVLIDLRPLPIARVREYLEWAGIGSISARSLGGCARACGGHPLAMVEMVRSIKRDRGLR